MDISFACIFCAEFCLSNASVHQRLHAEVARLPAATGPLELGTLRTHVRLLVLVRTEAEVANSLTSVLRATDENRVAARRSAHGKLVKRDRLTASRFNAGTRGVSEAERGNAQLRDLEQAVVVGDGANHNDGLRVLTVLANATLVARHVNDTRDRNRRTVDLRHEQTAQHCLVEARVRTARKEAVELHKQQQVRVLTLRCRTVARLDVMPLDVNTLALAFAPATATHHRESTSWDG